MQRLIMLLIGVLAMCFMTASQASGFRWNDHAHPYTFLFGNHIDTHQETRLEKDGALRGFFYVVHLDQDGDGQCDYSPWNAVKTTTAEPQN